ncbi:MAG: hypothetical protein UX09_C0025G0010 [Candidatus Uhrbacteria bacterium GW2011_GWE2_45_35]|uniref:Uncharacterized protein n=2 Tax=Candidatus Uhriibacteriota TaxID=1752732 RepID=A0A0G1JG75_9BACT|nr:MAG: hypothetical protein UW63_C0028G0010 [Candidatus Uhrbacteria bacterium GW2011_GWF2_44_350]KKU07720.1 MAG: hypothetical protein UX09_C0025G0010 [Candidatus Uhrbacteria bacterium GW2011_GWE2_45_35]HBR80994.1 hypothetical protein [Candidatus Uhrbacteria bacterium]HCU31396.1 hypothetical protein [Candidatus Uhrbacteria bacterium]
MDFLILAVAIVLAIFALNLIIKSLIHFFHFLDQAFRPFISKTGKVIDKKFTPSRILPGQEFYDPETSLTWGGERLIPAIYELTIEIYSQQVRYRIEKTFFDQFAIGDSIIVHHRLGRLSGRALINNIEKPTPTA